MRRIVARTRAGMGSAVARVGAVVFATVGAFVAGSVTAPYASAWVANETGTCGFAAGTKSATIHLTPYDAATFDFDLMVAVTNWNGVATPVKLTVVGPTEPADITVDWAEMSDLDVSWANGENCRTPDYISKITLNYTRLKDDNVATVAALAREIGHVMGLGDSTMDACSSLMSSGTSPSRSCTGRLKPDDFIGLRALYAPSTVPSYFPDSSFISDQIEGRGLDAPDIGGSTVYDYHRTGDAEQQWSFLPVSTGSSWGYIVNSRSGWCLSAGTSTAVTFVPVEQEQCQDVQAIAPDDLRKTSVGRIMWRFEQMPSGAYKIRNGATDKILDVEGTYRWDGARIGTFPDGGTYNQWWRVG